MKKWNKLAVLMLILTLVIMVVGLILIATANGGLNSENGFNYLKNNSISSVLSDQTPLTWSDNSWMQLKAGVIMAVIVTPLFIFLTLGSFLWAFMTSKR